MAPTLVAPPHLNGTGPVPPEVLREAKFYEDILQLRDAVYAGTHPRIKLPAHALEKVAPRPNHIPPPTTTKQSFVNATSNGTPAHQSQPPRPESSGQHYQTSNEYSSSPHHAQRPFSAKPTASGIDPVLLTKSDHLIRAEIQLKRQQIERTLKDQFDKRGRTNDPLAEDREALDVEGILNKVHALVKPVSGLPTAPSSPRSESFDENSYYSSKANSWSSEMGDPKPHAVDAVEPLTPQANQPAHKPILTAGNPVSGPTPRISANPAVIDLDEEPYEPADDIEIYEPEPANVSEEQEESDYSPPPADIGPIETDQDLGRVPESIGATNGPSTQHSPAGNPAPIQNARKRRREKEDRRGDRREERRRQQQANRRVVQSPEPYIKEEPQSPPPFASYPDSQSNKRRALQPLVQDVEVVPAREGRMPPVYYREQDNSPRSLRQYEEPLSPTVVRIPQRRVERDEHDLRRVASLQYARRPYSPTGLDAYPAVEHRQIRAASHAFVERPVEHVYRESSVRPSVAPRYVRERSRSPGHEYASRAQSPLMMAPPPRKIVVDQDGNRYYAAPIDVHASAAPLGRRMEAEPFYERASTREPTIRAPVRHEVYEDEHVQRMPPPPPRRYVEAPDAEVVEPRAYRHREVSHRPMEGEYVPREVVDRRTMMQYEDMAPPREHVPRAYSMRPEPVRREPADYAPVRYESVQPGFVRVAAPRYREVSVVQEQAFDERRYGFAAPPQGRRYVEEGAAAERPIELGHEVYGAEPRRVSSRY